MQQSVTSETEKEQPQINYYPQHLIPRKDLKFIHAFDTSDRLGKWVEPEFELKDEDGRLSSSAVDVASLAGFSTNKIPSSHPKDLKINFVCDKEMRSRYLAPWQVGIDGLVPENEEWEYREDRQLYFFKAVDVDGLVGDFNNPPDKPNKKFEFTLRIVHKPTMTNYWHFEFLITTNETAEPRQIKKMDDTGFRRVIGSKIIACLQETADFDLLIAN